jgi:uncharacterized protein YbjT (DUF2867 family)
MKSRVLITGANGFIGRHLINILLAEGHEITCGVRKLPKHPDERCDYIEMDFIRDVSPQSWAVWLADINIVINTIGIIAEKGDQTFEALHEKAPCALFKACEKAYIELVIQFSALGADANATSRYHLSKKKADDFLRSLDVPSVILQPSLIFGLDGSSTKFFTWLASLPILVLPGGGKQLIQPVHIHDVEVLVAKLVAKKLVPQDVSTEPATTVTIPVVGPVQLSLASYLRVLRRSLGLNRLYIFTLPRPLVSIAATLGRRGGMINREVLGMLERGSTGDASAAASLTKSKLIPPRHFIDKSNAESLRAVSLRAWILPVLRSSIAFVWIYTGVVSLGLYPKEDSLLLLNRVGIEGNLAPMVLYGAAIMDLLLGMATLFLTKRRTLWIMQTTVIVFYSLIISWKMPEFLIHPFGPLIKNIPMIALIWAMLKLER